MKRAALILARGFEESESLTIADVLIRAGLTCELTGLEEEIVEGAHGIQVKCDRVLGEDLTDYDMIILPGGYGGVDAMSGNEVLIRILQEMDRKGKFVCAICAAPAVLEKAGLLEAGAVALNLQGDLLMLGKQVYTNISYSQQMQYLLSASKEDLILIFSYTGSYFDYQELTYSERKRLSAPRIWMVCGSDRTLPPFVDQAIRFRSRQDQISHPYQLQFVAGLIAQEYQAIQ